MTGSPDPPPRPEADLLSAAVEYADQGIAIMPCVERGKKPALERTGKEHAVATSDPYQIRQWWTRNPEYNIGIVCTANRLAVIDIDGPAGIEWIRDNQLPMPATWTATTGNGFHYYYRWPAGQIIKTCRIAPKLEIRAAGAYVVAPPSIHPDGDTYEWAQSERCDWSALPEAPAEWAALQPSAHHDNVVYLEGGGNTVALKRLAGLAKYLAGTTKGERHSALYTIARTLGQLVASGHLTRDEIHAQLYDAAQRNGLAAEDGERNITQTINDGIEKGISDGPDPEHHETAERNPCILTPPGGISEARKHLLDIDAVIEAEIDNDAQWLIEPIIPAGKSAALYAPGKTGKSLLAFDLVTAAASGRSILGGEPLEEPIHVLYVDQEMTQDDLSDRLHDLGYTQPDPVLKEHLHYSQLYPWPPFDTKTGGEELLALALDLGAKLVVIDTLIRTVSGEENSADTIKNFYRHTAQPLKAAGIALLRIDHAGKDLTRGRRGTSAKGDDVDVVWLLKKKGTLPGKTMLTLVSTSRSNWIQEDIHITRNEGPPLTHVIPTVLELISDDFAIVHYLQDRGLWRHNVTVKGARQALNDSTKHTAKQVRLAQVVKWMKRYGDTSPEQGNAEGNAKTSAEGNAEGNASQKRVTPRSEAGNARVTPSGSTKQGKGNVLPPSGGNTDTPQDFASSMRGTKTVLEESDGAEIEPVSDGQRAETTGPSEPLADDELPNPW